LLAAFKQRGKSIAFLPQQVEKLRAELGALHTARRRAEAEVLLLTSEVCALDSQLQAARGRPPSRSRVQPLLTEHLSGQADRRDLSRASFRTRRLSVVAAPGGANGPSAAQVGRPLYMGQRVPSRCTRGLLTRICVSSLSTPLHALPSDRFLCRSPRCAGASAAGRTSAPSCSAWRTGASRRELPRALPLPRLHLGHTSVVSRLQELLRTLAALEKTEGDLNDDSLMKEMLFSSS